MALLPPVNTEPESAGDHPSLSDLHHVALVVLARALQSDDERIALRAAQIVVDRVTRAAQLAQTAPHNGEKVITLRYGGSTHDETYPNDNSADDPDDQTASWANQGYRAPGALQSGGLRTALGQDGNGQDRRD